ncbi:MAG: addiction module killer protein [Azoarcus sp.]|nr:addiction module killer protein [Azoarcus sp.]
MSPCAIPRRATGSPCAFAAPNWGIGGDCASVGEGVSEMRIHYGPGYRVYFTQTGRTIYLLLAGGDKPTQKGDIKAAQDMARQIKDQED